MKSERINIVRIISKYLSKKMVFVRNDVTVDSEMYPDALITYCDEITYARSYEKCPVFIIVAIVEGAEHVYTYHNITFAEVIYAR